MAIGRFGEGVGKDPRCWGGSFDGRDHSNLASSVSFGSEHWPLSGKQAKDSDFLNCDRGPRPPGHPSWIALMVYIEQHPWHPSVSPLGILLRVL